MNYDERVQLAKVAYQAYGDTAGWKNFQGDPMPTWDDLAYGDEAGWKNKPMPTWDDLGDRIQDCWIMAASAAVEYAQTPPYRR